MQWEGQPGHFTETPNPPPAHKTSLPTQRRWQYLLAAAVGFADVAEELKGLLRGRAGCGRGGRGGVAGPGPGGEGYSAEGPAVTALQNGDLQGAPGTPHLHRKQKQMLPAECLRRASLVLNSQGPSRQPTLQRGKHERALAGWGGQKKALPPLGLRMRSSSEHLYPPPASLLLFFHILPHPGHRSTPPGSPPR